MKAYNKKCKPKHLTKTKYRYFIVRIATTRSAKASSSYDIFLDGMGKDKRYKEIFL